MTTIFQTLVPNVVAAATVPSDSQKDALTYTDQQRARRRKRHKEETTTCATVAPLSTSVHGLEKSTDRSKPGTVNVIRLLSMDSRTAVKCQISSSTTYTDSLVQPQWIPVSWPWLNVFYCKHLWNYVGRDNKNVKDLQYTGCFLLMSEIVVSDIPVAVDGGLQNPKRHGQSHTPKTKSARSRDNV